MLEVKGDLFDFLNDEETNAICITTNGIVGADGKAIMGAGTAGEAAKRWPRIRSMTGAHINQVGNLARPIGLIDDKGEYQIPDAGKVQKKEYKCLIFSFPTKNDFRKPAVPELIKSSAEEMVKFADALGLKKIIIPAPGCGSFTGQLDWEKDVKPLIKDILDDRFIITFLDSK